MDECRENLLLQRGHEFFRIARQLFGRPGVVGQHFDEDLEVRQIRRLQLAGHAEHDRAEVPHLAVRPFDVAAKPIKVVGHAAGQVVRATAEFHGRHLRAEESDCGDRPVGEDPNIFASSTGRKLVVPRSRPAHGRLGVGGRQRPGQSARHDLIRAVAVSGYEDPHPNRPALDASANENRRGRSVDAVLRRVGPTMLADRLQQPLALLPVQIRRIDRELSARRHRGPDHHFVEMGLDVGPVVVAAAPPRRHGPELQVLAQPAAADGRQKRHENGRFQEAAAQGIGNRDLSAPRRLHQPRDAVQRIGAQFQWIGFFIERSA